MKYAPTDWNVYRTRFLVRARQLTEPLLFVDALGREHQGDIGDYLVESSDGSCRIARQEIFEDIYVAMGPAEEAGWSSRRRLELLPDLGEPVSTPAMNSRGGRSLEPQRPSGTVFS